MPPRVHLVTISPQLNDDNELALKMIVAGDSRERAIELAKRMEDSRRFAQTRIVSETQSGLRTGDTEQVEIAAIYIPEPLHEEAPASASGSSAKASSSRVSTTKGPGVKGATSKSATRAKPTAKGTNH